MNVKLTLKSLWLAVMLTVATAAMAQTKVTGIVYEPDGTTPVIGATVVQTGTNKGTSTDADGKFTLTVKGKKRAESELCRFPRQPRWCGND